MRSYSMFRWLIMIMLGAGLIGVLEGCGRKGPPVAPGEPEPEYRRDL